MKKNKKRLLGALGIVVLIAAFAWIARPVGTSGSNNSTQGGNNGKSALSADELSYDFGTVSMANGKVKHEFKIKNNNDGSVTINKIYTSCMCTTAELALGAERLGPFGMPGHGAVPTIKKEMTAGQEAVVEVTFDPAAHGPAGVGRISREITVETGAKPLVIKISAQVIP